MKLNSDFRDWYDHMFNDKGPTLHRYAETMEHRYVDFSKLRAMGLNVPIYGYKGTLKDILGPGFDVVRYENPWSHRGEGKTLTQYGKLDDEDIFSQYIKSIDKDGRPLSVRYLHIGGHLIMLRYCSDDSFRSNVGNVDVSIIHHVEQHRIPEKFGIGSYPLLGIDMVCDSSDKMFAIDLNTAPGIPKEVQDVLGASRIVDALEEYAIGLQAIKNE